MLNRKVVLSGLLSLFITGSVNAAVNPTDQSATLNISGSVADSEVAGCSVGVIGGNTILLESMDDTDLLNQDENGTHMTIVPLHIYGVKNLSDCYDVIQNGRLALRLTGQGDNATGTVLQNSGTATGVGIGIYNYDTTKPVLINNGNLEVKKDGTANLGLQSVKLSGQSATAGSMKGTLTVEIERL